MNHSLAESVFSTIDAHSNASSLHQPGDVGDGKKDMPLPDLDALPGQTAAASGSVRSGLVMSIILKVHETSEPTSDGFAMAALPGYPGALPPGTSADTSPADMPGGIGAINASQPGDVTPKP